MKKKINNNKREIILKSAKKLFANKGYENTSVRDIVEEANTSMGNLYYHFPNKHEMLRVICDEFVTICGFLVSSDDCKVKKPSLQGKDIENTGKIYKSDRECFKNAGKRL